MALDNAEFISELSITDPPGTDPLNQGDDHLRTIKKAVQQSFPNVGSAVPQTGVQMAQMAIKNEVNTFTQAQVFQAQIQAAAGVNLAPSYSFTTDLDTGMFLGAVGLLSFAVAGAARFTIEASRIRFIPPLRPDADGTAAAPQYSFFNSSNLGMYREAANVLAFSVGGVRQSRVFTTFWQFFQPILGPSGTAADPSFGITGAAGMGMYEAGTDILSLAVASAPRFATGLGFSQLYQNTSTGGVALNFGKSNGIVGYSFQYEGTAGFQPQQFSLSRFNRDTGAFIDIPFYINATTGRVHTALPVLSP